MKGAFIKALEQEFGPFEIPAFKRYDSGMPPRTPLSERKQKPTGPMDRVAIGLRVPASDLEKIDQRAAAAGMLRSEYMIRCSLGEPIDSRSFEHRLNELEASLDERIARLERNFEYSH